MFRIFRSSRGLIDLQSVMVGIIVSSLVASVSIVSIVGMIRMTAVDNGKSRLQVIATGLESYYAANDRYPTDLTTLANGDYIPHNIVGNTSFCYQANTASPYPQSYVAAVKIPQTGDIFFASENSRKPQLAASGQLYCFTS